MGSGIFALIADDPEWLGCILSHHDEALGEAASSAGPWQAIYYQDGDVLIRSHPAGRTGGERIGRLLRQVRTRALLGYCQEADPDERVPLDAVRTMGWAWVQQGETRGFASVRDQVRRAMPDFLARTLRGEGEAEHVFHLVLSFLYDSGDLSNPDLPAAELIRGLDHALRMLGEIYPAAGLEPPAMDVLVTNGYSAAGYNGRAPMPVRTFHRPALDQDEVHRGVGEIRRSGEFPTHPRTGHRAVLVGSAVVGEADDCITGQIARAKTFGITRSCEILIVDR